MTTGEKFEKIADIVYDKGASDFGTHFDVTGTNLVTIDKVHPKEHDVEVELESKNLISSSVFADYELQEDGSYYAEHKKAIKNYSFELPIGTYTVSYQIKAPANTNYRIVLSDENGTTYQEFFVTTGEFQSRVFTFSNTAKITNICISFGSSGEGVYFKDLQIEKGSVATAYTPYIDTSTDIETVTACGKNLLNVDALIPAQSGRIEPIKNEDGSYTLTKGAGHNRSTNAVPFNYIIPKGTTVTFSVRFLDRQYIPNGDMCFMLTNNGVLAQEIRTVPQGVIDGVYKQTVTLSQDITGWYISMIYAPEAGMSFTFDKLQLEFGNTMTEYEKFEGGTYPATDGKATVKSVSPTMNITTPTSGVSIEAKGLLDGQAVIDELTQAIVNVGGEI